MSQRDEESDESMMDVEQKRSLPVTLAVVFAVLRGAMLILYSIGLSIAPEKLVPGSSGEPVRSLALMFVSRTALLGASLVVLAIRGQRKALGWVIIADAVLQVFDTGMALAMAKGPLALAPAAIGAIEALAGMTLLRSKR
jgi:hypothetical protein